jgi:non-heme chloroperoxidase
MPYVTVGSENGNPVEIFYEDHGTGAPVVLIHGWPLSGRSWEPQVPALLDADYRVITYDRRGFGASSQPWEGYDYDTFAADLNTLITSIGLTGVTLVGFSMGGGEVVRYLSRYGSGAVSKVVLAGAVPPFLLKTDDNPDGGLTDADVDGMQAGVRADRPKFFDEFFPAFCSAGKKLKVSDAQVRYLHLLAMGASPKGTVDCISAFSRTDFRGDLSAVTVPTLVIHGDSDNIVPFEVSGHRSAEAIAGAELVVLKDGPHAIGLSHPEEFNTALLEFLAR